MAGYRDFKAVRVVNQKGLIEMGKVSKEMRKAYEPFRLEYLTHLKGILMECKHEVLAAQKFAPLSRDRLDTKLRRGLSLKIYKATGETTKAMTADINRANVYLGIRSGKKHSITGTQLALIPFILRDVVNPSRDFYPQVLALAEAKMAKTSHKVFAAYRLLYHIRTRGITESMGEQLQDYANGFDPAAYMD